MVNRTSGWVKVGTIAGVVAAAWIVLSPPGLWDLYESGRLSGIVAALAWLVPLVALLGAVWKWRLKWKQWVREKYVSAVVWLARPPVREDVVDRLRSEGAPQEELMSAVYGLSEAPARILGMVLEAYDPRGDGWIRIKPTAKPLRDRKRPETKTYIGLVIKACDELQRARFVSQVEELEGDAWVRVLLSDAVRDAPVLKLEEAVSRHLVKYIVYPTYSMAGIEAEPAHSAEES